MQLTIISLAGGPTPTKISEIIAGALDDSSKAVAKGAWLCRPVGNFGGTLRAQQAPETGNQGRNSL